MQNQAIKSNLIAPNRTDSTTGSNCSVWSHRWSHTLYIVAQIVSNLGHLLPTMSRVCVMYVVVCMLCVCVSVTCVPNGAVCRGLLCTFERKQPLVLLLTTIGLQMLTDNQTCYDNQTSLYYPSEFRVKYADYSTKDNYLLYVGLNVICLKSLFKSAWNNAIQRDVVAECRDMRSGKHFGLNIARHTMFVVNDDGVPVVIPINSPLCQDIVLSTIEVVANIVAVHVTNFHNTDIDRLLIANSNLVRVYSLDGEKHYDYRLDRSNNLKAVASDSNRNYFIAATDNSALVVFKFHKRLTKNSVQTLMREQSSNGVITFVSLSVSHSLVALLVSEGTDGTGNNTEVSYRLHLKPNSATAMNQSASVVQCTVPPGDLFGVLVVEDRVQLRDLSYCEGHESECEMMGQSAICDCKVSRYDHNLSICITFPFKQTVFKFNSYFLLDETAIVSELIHKTILTAILTVTCFVFVMVFQILNNT